MYLLLGHATDPCCAGVAARLDARGLNARIVVDPLAPPAALAWRLDHTGVASRLSSDLPDSAIAGVLVRDTGWLDPAGWDKDDHAYMQAELRAVMLAWLAGLSCPVINPPDPALWYRAGAPLVAWRPLLRREGLPLPEVVITSDPAEADAFRRRLAADGVNGAVYSPLTSGGRLCPCRRRCVGAIGSRAEKNAGLPDGAARRSIPRLRRRQRGDLEWRGVARRARARAGAPPLRRGRASDIRRDRARPRSPRPRCRTGRSASAARTIRRVWPARASSTRSSPS